MIVKKVAENGDKQSGPKLKWNEIAAAMRLQVEGSTRTGKQCRERYLFEDSDGTTSSTPILSMTKNGPTVKSSNSCYSNKSTATNGHKSPKTSEGALITTSRTISTRLSAEVCERSTAILWRCEREPI